MLLKVLCKSSPWGKLFTTKTLLIMKLTAIILLSACLTTSAKVHSQRVTLSLQNASMETVFQEIKKQTGYDFLYGSKMLQVAKPVSINVKNASLEQVLEKCFKDQPLTYNLVDRTIIVKPKTTDPNINPGDINEPPPPIDVEGKVTNENGEPVEGASISIKGTNRGTTTDANGNFTLQVPDGGGVLVISYVGYQTIEIPVSKATTAIKIVLKQAEAKVEEVVVIGYGTQRKTNLTGAIATIPSSAYKDQPVVSVSSALQGRASGVAVNSASGAPGGVVKVRIRGTNSINSSNDPLFVVDGVALGSVSFQDININDIESMEVLKDASATAIYGSRGANGVILITTKRGKADKMSIEFNTFVSANKIKKYDLLDPVAYAEQANHISGISVFPNPASLAGTGTDWQDQVYQAGITQNYQLSLAGGTEKARYYFSGYYVGQSGIVTNTSQDKIALRANIDSKISDKLSVGVNLFLTHIKSQNNGDLGSKGSPVFSSLSWAPTEPVYDDPATGQYNRYAISPIWSNPYMIAQESDYDGFSNSVVVK